MKTRYESEPSCPVAKALVLFLLTVWAAQGAQAQVPVPDHQGDSTYVDPESGYVSASPEAVGQSDSRDMPASRVGMLARQVSASGKYSRDIDESHYEVDILPYAWYNRVDGAHLGVDRMVESSRYFRVGGGVGWSSGLTGGDRWTWHASARLKSTGKNSVFLKGQYLARTARRYGEASYVPTNLNSLVMMLGGDDYFDYYRSEGFAGTAGVDFDAVRTRLSATFRSEDHTSLPLTTSYDLFNGAPLRANPGIALGRLQTVSANILVGAAQSGNAVAVDRSLELGAETSTSGSDFSFRRYWVDARWQQATYCRQCKNPGTLALRMAAGTSTGNLPLQRAFVVDNSHAVFSAFGALRTVTGPPFEGDKMVAVFWEHNFGKAGLEALGLRGLARDGISLLAFGGHTGTWTIEGSHEQGDPMQVGRVLEGTYHELGVSLRGFFDGVRVDFAKSLDGGPMVVGLGIDLTSLGQNLRKCRPSRIRVGHTSC